jgi:hypothetical protein
MKEEHSMNKTKIDYDLNIFIPEELDKHDNSVWDHTKWMIHVYIVQGNTHAEADEPFHLTIEDIDALGLNSDPYFTDVDSWYGHEGFIKDYWGKMTDRVKEYLESFPKYY